MNRPAKPRVRALLDYVASRHPRSSHGLDESKATDPELFDELLETLLEWVEGARGSTAIPDAVESYVRFVASVNLAQARYEIEGRYPSRTFEDVERSLYSDQAAMDDYILGVYLSNVLWAHHLELSRLFLDRFVPGIGAPQAQIVELAPGHGAWGLLALSRLPGATLLGYDVSQPALDLATSLARAAGFGARAKYERADVLELATQPEVADAVISNFLVEHLERPEPLFASIAHVLRPGRRAFVSGALTAAQPDHILELRRESELVLLCEQHGLRVIETRSVSPRRTQKGARFLPRSMSLIVEKRSLP
ncbi:MAG: class I SAM-dependent methyltransferase [Deltaproteobacteria bacterium]|nr:class I SAM-dependent methyltransferase [Deltaproteobacteria bacterium]